MGMGVEELGSRIWHMCYGGGVVEALVAGRRARVRFDGAPDLPRTVLRAELQIGKGARPEKSASRDAASDPPRSRSRSRSPSRGGQRAEVETSRSSCAVAPPPPAEPVLPPESATPVEVADIRQTLEALRMGVVPSRHVEDYTVGRADELRELAALFDEGRGLRAVWGGYGAGKTHLLDVAEHLARERGFATSRVVLDPFDVPPTHPKRLYAEIVRGLRLPHSADVGFEPLAQALCESPEHLLCSGRAFSRFLSPYLHALHAHDEEAIGWLRDYVEGETVDGLVVNAALRRLDWNGPRALAMSDFRTYGRVYLHLIGTLACWIRDVGHRGLVILFDEVEYVDTLTREELRYAIEVLKHFAAVTAPRTSLGFDPDDHGQLYRGGHAVHQRISLRFQEDQALCVVFALTPFEEVEELYARIVNDARFSIELRPLRRTQFDELMDRVERLYRRGYPGFSWTTAERRRAKDRVMDALDDDASTVRKVVQRSVFVLDEHRYGERLTDGP